MRFPKFLLVLSCITFIALVYTYQQSQIFYLAYQTNKRQSRLQETLDRNHILRYNIGVFGSLPCLEKSLLIGDSDFEIAQDKQLVRLKVIKAEEIANLATRNKPNLILSLFNIITKQAEARPINR